MTPRFLICSSLNLLVAELAVGPVHLGEHVPGVDEQDLVPLVRPGLVLVEEPEGGRQGDGGEHVGGQGDHLADDALLDHLFADGVFALASVGGGVGHDQGGLAVVVHGGGEVADPEIVGVGDGLLLIGFLLGGLGGVAGHAVGAEAGIVFDLVHHHLVHVEGRIGHDVIEAAHGAVGVGVIGVGLYDLAADVVQQQVHLGQLHGVRLLLHAVAAELHLLGPVLIVPVHIPGRLDEHAAGTAGGVQELLVAGLGVQHFHHVADDGGGGIE